MSCDMKRVAWREIADVSFSGEMEPGGHGEGVLDTRLATGNVCKELSLS
jgi:hypothetical protein